MKLKSPYLIKAGQKVRLDRIPAHTTGHYEHKDQANADLERHRQKLLELQELLVAETRHALLVVLQGMDTAGKDGTISHIFTGVNPQGCSVTSFKVPTPLEARHDFLWRAHNAVPPKGMIGIFNRSHYEDVLWPRVHQVIHEKDVRSRFEDIRNFEASLARNGVTILKFFLHISREEQTQRLAERIADANKHWKISEADFHERHFWPDYKKAYEDLLAHTSCKHAPWFVIPSDQKWYRNAAISEILVSALKGLKMKYPRPTFDPKAIKLD
jgi:PPK2 family polyphosphate:nucleotide phosphotransferase